MPQPMGESAPAVLAPARVELEDARLAAMSVEGSLAEAAEGGFPVLTVGGQERGAKTLEKAADRLRQAVAELPPDKDAFLPKNWEIKPDGTASQS